MCIRDSPVCDRFDDRYLCRRRIRRLPFRHPAQHSGCSGRSCKMCIRDRDKAEVDLDPSIDLYDHRVYEKAAENLQKMIDDGVYRQETAACYYIYRQVMDGRGVFLTRS